MCFVTPDTPDFLEVLEPAHEASSSRQPPVEEIGAACTGTFELPEHQRGNEEADDFPVELRSPEPALGENVGGRGRGGRLFWNETGMGGLANSLWLTRGKAGALCGRIHLAWLESFDVYWTASELPASAERIVCNGSALAVCGVIFKQVLSTFKEPVFRLSSSSKFALDTRSSSSKSTAELRL